MMRSDPKVELMRRKALRGLLCGAACAIGGIGATAQTTRPNEPSPAAADWPIFRGDAQLRGVARSPLADELRPVWQTQLGDGALTSAVIAGGRVYVGSSDGTLYAVALRDGSIAWKFSAGEPAGFLAAPTVARAVPVPSTRSANGDGRAAVEEQQTGRRPVPQGEQTGRRPVPQEQQTGRGAVRDADSSGVLVLAGNEDGTLFALDAADGALRWKYETMGEIASAANVSGGDIVFGSYDGHVYCLGFDGRLKWKHETPDKVHGTPGISEGHVIFAGCDGMLHVVRLEDGGGVRKVELGSVSGACAAIAGARVYVGTHGGRLLGIDWRAGRVEWSFQDEREMPLIASAAVSDDLVVIGGRSKRIWAFSPSDGKQMWSFAARGRVESSAAIVSSAGAPASRRVFVGAEDGNLYALSAADGKVVWRFEAGSAITASPAVGERCLVIGTQDGLLYCFSGRE